ncbi:MAG: hypothetical protein WCV50_05505 [Patescibacteria group bacterium]|jgi:hypothetical protein
MPKKEPLDKRLKVRQLLQAGQLTKAEIMTQAGCSAWLVRDVDKELHPKPEEEQVPKFTDELQISSEVYVCSDWLVNVVSWVRSAILRHLKDKGVSYVIRYRQPYLVPVRFYKLSEVWTVFPEWKKRYEDSREKTEQALSAASERPGFRDLSDAQYWLLCSLIDWWLQHLYWPSAEDLLTMPDVNLYLKTAGQVRDHLRELQKKGYLTRTEMPASRGAHSVKRSFRIHRGPKCLTTELVNCPKCHNAFRIPRPFYEPRSVKVK